MSKIPLKLLNQRYSPDLESIIFPEIYPIPIFEPKTYQQIFDEVLPEGENNPNGESLEVDSENKSESIYNELITYKVIPYEVDYTQIINKSDSNLNIQFLSQSIEEEEELKTDSELKKIQFFNFLLFILSRLLIYTGVEQIE